MLKKHLAYVKNGKITFSDRARFDSDVSIYEEKTIEIIVREQKKRRSLNLNAYYWSVVVKLLSEHTGYDKDDMHEILKSMFLRTRYKLNGVWTDGTKSTTKLSSKEMIEFIDNVKRFASTELSVYIPDPNDVEHG